MTPELKAKWVEALRSGKYAQGKRALRTGRDKPENDLFCCLGVLCDLIAPELWDRSCGRHNGYESLPSPRVMRLAELSEKLVRDAADLNDGTPTVPSRTFPEIADWIETHV